MDFFRRVLLVLVISVFVAGAAHASGVTMGSASQSDGPARASSSYAHPAAAAAVDVTSQTHVLAASATTTTSTTYYGSPYYADDYYFGRGPNEAALSAAVNDWWTLYQSRWGVNPSNCGYYDFPTGDGNTTGTFVLMYVSGSACGGGPSGVYGTAYTYDPGKNNGNGTNCSGGTGGTGSSCPDKGSADVGDPINSSTGNKYLEEEDFPNAGWLTFRRFYNSVTETVSTTVGAQWRHSFDRSLGLTNAKSTPETALAPNAAILYRPDGTQETFAKNNGVWSTSPDIADQLVENDNTQGVATSYTVFVAALRQFETYNTSGVLQAVTDETGMGITLTYSTASTPTTIAPAAGLLLTVTDPNGRQLNFTYTSASQVYQVTLPDAGKLTYTYDSSTGNLVSVEYPDQTVRQYVYNESSLTGGTNLPDAMTGIVDESGVRYANTTYSSSGLATSSSFAGSVLTTQITYNSNGTSTVLYPLGTSATLSFTTVNGLIRVANLNQPCGPQCSQPWKTRTYDANSYPQDYTDFNGNITNTTYDVNGLLDQQVDASGTSSQHTTTTTWNTALRVPLTRTVSNASGTVVSSTQWVYNTAGQTLARCDIDPTNSAASGYSCSNTGAVPAGVRRSTYTYCTAVGTGCPLVGLVLTATGSRTDLTQTTTYTYYTTSNASSCGTPGAACYQPGDLHTVTDPAGHVTTIASYDADGRITRTSDANGINTDLTYTPRGWLASRSVGGATTSFTYTPYGAVQTATDPDGVTTTYGYDTAHRLTRVTDAQGNTAQYTLDAAGDKTAEQTYDASGTVHKSLTRTFNTLGQLTTVVDGLNHTVFNASTSTSYDANGNLIQSADALGIQLQQGYDALNRLVQTIDNYNGAN